MTTLDGAVDLARDRELVERCQMGDEGSFAELYERYHRRLLRFCLRRLHSHDDAEEAVQEAFTRAWRALPKFGGDRRFYPWLTVIAGNVCTDMLRRSSRVVPMDEMPHHAVEVDGEDIDAELLRQVDLAMATEAFAHLSDRHQRVLRLREGTEWSAQRIAEVEGVAVPAVDTLLWRARQAFKREFAVLSDAGGLAGIIGIGVAALRRGLARAWLRAASHAPAPLRGPGVLAATVAITGAAIAGGSIALVGAGPAPHAVPGISTSSTSRAQSHQGGEGGPSSQRTHAGGTGGTRTTTGRATRSSSTRAMGGGGGGGTTSGLAGVMAGTGTSGAPSLAATGLGGVFSGVGGLTLPLGQGGTAPTSTSTVTAATGTATGAVTTATGTVTSTTGAVTSTTGAVTTATGTVTSATGTVTSTTGAVTSTTATATGTVGTAVQTVTTSTTGSSGVGSPFGGL